MAPVGQRFSHALHPVQFSAMMVNGMLVAYFRISSMIVAMAVLDQLIVAPRLLEREVGEKHHQQHHRHDRDVVRNGQDFEKLLKPGNLHD